MASINSKIKQLMGLKRGDLTDWEASFIQSIKEKTQGGNLVGNLTEKQLDAIDSIYDKHFVG